MKIRKLSYIEETVNHWNSGLSKRKKKHTQKKHINFTVVRFLIAKYFSSESSILVLGISFTYYFNIGLFVIRSFFTNDIFRHVVTKSCRNFKVLFHEARERASKALGFAKKLRKVGFCTSL